MDYTKEEHETWGLVFDRLQVARASTGLSQLLLRRVRKRTLPDLLKFLKSIHLLRESLRLTGALFTKLARFVVSPWWWKPGLLFAWSA